MSDDTWVDFAKRYRKRMKEGFTPQAMATQIASPKVRLYFHYMFGENYDREIVRRYTKTPLLGQSPYPDTAIDYTGAGLSQAVAPLRKHLLVADELWVPDNFYRCFDFVAENYPRETWRASHYQKCGVERSIAAILQWLPILAGLRELIVSNAIVFMPYYVVPSFPYAAGDPFTEQQMARLDIPPDPAVVPASESAGFDLHALERLDEQPPLPPGELAPWLNCNSAVYAWINARLLGLDPVFADARTWQWASRIQFREETTANVTTDLMSIDILPLGERKELSVGDIVSMRDGEEVFRHMRETLTGCKTYVERNVRPDATKEFITRTCREYIRDHLDSPERLKAVKFVNNNLFAGTVFSIAVGAAFLTTNPWIGLLVPAALTPQALLAAEGKFNPKIRAASRLDALL